MVFFSFGNLAFNQARSESTIDMVVASKEKYKDVDSFLDSAVTYLDAKIYPDSETKQEYEGAILKDGNYNDIVRQYIEQMDKKVSIEFDDIQKIRRIKFAHDRYLREEFIIETVSEYIMMAWSTSA